MPDVQPAPTTPAASHASGGGINTTRPPGASGASTPVQTAATPTGAPASIQPQPTPPWNPMLKRTWIMMHEELYAALPDCVFNSLETNSHQELQAAGRLQEVHLLCPLYDSATGAPFGHQLQLSLAKNAHFDPVKRGHAHSVAGRSVGIQTSGVSALADAAGRRSVFQEFSNNWAAMENYFCGAGYASIVKEIMARLPPQTLRSTPRRLSRRPLSGFPLLPRPLPRTLQRLLPRPRHAPAHAPPPAPHHAPQPCAPSCATALRPAACAPTGPAARRLPQPAHCTAHRLHDERHWHRHPRWQPVRLRSRHCFPRQHPPPFRVPHPAPRHLWPLSQLDSSGRPRTSGLEL
jgi:hypothetical protein